jgi:TfuA protein
MSFEDGIGAHASRIVVFTGPSLHPCEAATLLSATFLPPIKRGDLAPLCDSKPAIVGIIDGEFYQSLAVTPKEVLKLLEAGVAVYGAASMGALRAVELNRYGMIGVGSVYRLFRRGVLDADDEVALAYSSETFRAVSEPLVNTRYGLRAAVRCGVLNRTEAHQIIAAVRSVYFPERTRELVLWVATKVVGSTRAYKLRDILTADAHNVKKRDAKLLLDRIRSVPAYLNTR